MSKHCRLVGFDVWGPWNRYLGFTSYPAEHGDKRFQNIKLLIHLTNLSAGSRKTMPIISVSLGEGSAC